MSFVLDAYAARSCPLKTVHAHTPGLEPPLPARPDPPFFRDADAIEAAVTARLVGADARVADLRPLAAAPAEEAQAACLEALAAGVDVVIGPRLPRDLAGHRSGRPSLLVRARDGDPGYHPVHLKFHRVIESAPLEGPSLPVSTLEAPRAPVHLPRARFRWSTRSNVALQLAHYWRLLEAAGLAAATPWAGVVGVDQVNVSPDGEPAVVGPVITWLDLAEARLPPSPLTDAHPFDPPPVSALARYDEELAHRVRLAEAAAAGAPESSFPLPVITGECRGCVWLPRCEARLDPDDLSLRLTKGPLDAAEVRALRRLGVTTVHDLAAADPDAVRPAFPARPGHREEPDARLHRALHRAHMLAAGVEVERRTAGPLALPVHALEIDVDIETSADDRVYLWGFLVDDPHAGAPVYREFSAFADLDDEREAALAASALAWLRDVTRGRDAAVYHYSDYEVLRVLKLAARFPDADVAAWAREATAALFVDLFQVVREHYLGANGLGLKVVATAATGFRWRDSDPGGLNSQAWFADAVTLDDPDARALARLRVLEYNEDDVRATWHLRRWLRQQD